jgi:hypothetical protein
MMYRQGDYVYPSDLPRRFLRRVSVAQSFEVGQGTSQILKLEPLAGPWPAGTRLIRLDADVMPVRTRGLSRSGTLRRSAHRAAVGQPARPGADQRAAR